MARRGAPPTHATSLKQNIPRACPQLPLLQLLVALGTSAAWVYSLLAMALAARAGGVGPGGGMGAGYHVYFETSALIITFVCLGAAGAGAGRGGAGRGGAGRSGAGGGGAGQGGAGRGGAGSEH
jgi:uncharacterized membrane protein YgcG